MTSTTPLWVPLAVAGLGITGTLFGVFLTQRQANKSDALVWERNQQQWDRDDALRTFDHRRDAYVAFYEAVTDMTLAIYNHGIGKSAKPDDSDDGGMPEGFHLPAHRALQRLRIYATPTVTEAAEDAYGHAWLWGSSARYSQPDHDFYGVQAKFDDAESELLMAIREDLKVPND